jgi:hypothetical protein
MTFEKYQHVERLGTDETEGVLDGIVHVFYKLDGTNGQIWWKGRVHCGSRNRELDLQNDNAGFMNAIVSDPRYLHFFEEYPTLRLYGEWLVPHSLKTYSDDAWRKFYIFDVFQEGVDIALAYEDYKPLLDKHGLDYVPPLCIMKNPTEEQIYKALEKCGQFLVKDGFGIGEGIVLKNYSYINKYGRQTWAKLITNEFKGVHHREMGAPLVNGSLLVEERIVEEFVTEAFILKEKAKIELENGGWDNKCIPKLLGVVFYELVREECWNFIKKHKNPKINFGLLNKMTMDKTKRVIGL